MQTQIVDKYNGTDFVYAVYFTAHDGNVVFETAYRKDLLDNAVAQAAHNNEYYKNDSFVAKVKNIYQL